MTEPHQKHWLGRPQWVKKEKPKEIDLPMILLGAWMLIVLIIAVNNATFHEPDRIYTSMVIGKVVDINYNTDKILLESKNGERMGYSFKDHSHYLQNNTEYVFRYRPGLGTVADTGYTIKELYQQNNDWTWIDEIYLFMGWTDDFKHSNRMIGDPNVWKGGCIETRG